MDDKLLSRRKSILVLLVVVVILSITAISLFSREKSSVVIEYRFYDASGELISDFLGRPRLPGDYRVFVQIYAMAPPGSSKRLVEVYKGVLGGARFVLSIIEDNSVFADIVRGWISFKSAQGAKFTEESRVGLQVNIWVVDVETGSVIERYTEYIDYSPLRISRGGVERSTIDIKLPPVQPMTSSKMLGAQISPAQIGCISWYEWRVNFTLAPENYTSIYGSDIRYYDGAYYVKMPILVISNEQRYFSGELQGSIGVTLEDKTLFYASVGIGTGIASKLKSGDVTGGLSKKVGLSGVSRSDYFYNFWDPDSISGGEEGYVWIWARPVFVYYNEYYIVVCTGYYEESYTGKDKVDFYVEDIIVETNNVISGGVEYSVLPSYIRQWLFDDSLSRSEFIVVLEPGTGIPFNVLIPDYIDTCGANFEVSLSGAILASAAQASPVSSLFAPLVALIEVSVSLSDSTSIFVIGGVENEGPYVEYLYMRFSKIQYKKSGLFRDCYYDVPVAMMFVGE